MHVCVCDAKHHGTAGQTLNELQTICIPEQNQTQSYVPDVHDERAFGPKNK